MSFGYKSVTTIDPSNAGAYEEKRWALVGLW
jgi:hypothetical protein